MERQSLYWNRTQIGDNFSQLSNNSVCDESNDLIRWGYQVITWAQFRFMLTCAYDDTCSIYDMCSFHGNAHVVNHQLLFTTYILKMTLFLGTDELSNVEYGKGITLAVIMCFYFYPQFSGVGSTAVSPSHSS